MSVIENVKLNNGDKVFLFFTFPYSFEKLPLEMIKGVELICLPNRGFLDKDDQEAYSYALPPISLSGFGVPQTSIRITSEHKNQRELFWQTIFAIRLIKSLKIGTSGYLTYKHNNSIAIDDPCGLIWRYTVINCSSDKYVNDDFKNAGELLKKIITLKKTKDCNRFINALNIFSEVANGNSTSYGMNFLSLFNCLEGLFISKSDSSKGTLLSQRVNSFVGKFFPDIEVKYFIKREYNRRNALTHGGTSFWISTKTRKLDTSVSKENYSILLNLYEITRLSILGFLGLTPDELKKYSSIREEEKGLEDALREILKGEKNLKENRKKIIKDKIKKVTKKLDSFFVDVAANPIEERIYLEIPDYDFK